MRTSGHSQPIADRLRDFLHENRLASTKQWSYLVLACLVGVFVGRTVTNADNPLLLPFLLAGWVAAVVVLLNIDLCMVIFLFFMYSRTPSVLADDHDVSGAKQGVIVFAGIALLIHWLRRGRLPQDWIRPVLYAGAYIMTWYLSYVDAVNLVVAQEESLYFLKSLVPGLLLFFLMRDYRAARIVVWTLLAVGIFLGTLCTFQQLSGTFDDNYWGYATAAESYAGEKSYRIAGPFGDPNYFGMILVPLVPLALDRFWSARSARQRFFAVWCLATCILTIVFTYSRGSFLGLAVVIALMFVRRPPKLSSLVLTGVLSLFLLLLIPENYRDRIISIDDVFSTTDVDATEKSTVSGRVSEAIVAYRMFMDHPLTGVGVGNYPGLYQSYSLDLGISGKMEARNAHSLPLEIASETGIVGLTGFFILIAGVFTGLRGARRKLAKNGLEEEADLTGALTVGMIGYLVCSLFLHAAIPIFFWLLIGACFGLKKIADRVPQARTIPGT